MNVSAERFERRDVDDTDFIRQRSLQALAEQLVERVQKRRQCLARSGGRSEQRMTTLADRGPPLDLSGRGRTELSREPLRNSWMERSQGHNVPSAARPGAGCVGCLRKSYFSSA